MDAPSGANANTDANAVADTVADKIVERVASRVTDMLAARIFPALTSMATVGHPVGRAAGRPTATTAEHTALPRPAPISPIPKSAPAPAPACAPAPAPAPAPPLGHIHPTTTYVPPPHGYVGGASASMPVFPYSYPGAGTTGFTAYVAAALEALPPDDVLDWAVDYFLVCVTLCLPPFLF